MLAIAVFCLNASAQECYPQGTRWIELRLDTLKHNSWFSEGIGRERHTPNYEKVEYYVQGDSLVDFGNGILFRYVWRHIEGRTDSVEFVITEHPTGQVSVTKTYEEACDNKQELHFQYPAMLYDFNWDEGDTRWSEIHL